MHRKKRVSGVRLRSLGISDTGSEDSKVGLDTNGENHEVKSGSTIKEESKEDILGKGLNLDLESVNKSK